MSRVVVVGGGLAGIAAAVDLADRGVPVTLLERRPRLGGATTSFLRSGLWVDNGQHVFLRCCTAYRELLARLGVAGQVHLQDRMDIPVVAPGGRVGRLRRSGLPAPMHLAGALARYPFLSGRERLRVAKAAVALRRQSAGDPSLDEQSFGAWLAGHGQSDRAVERFWDLVVTATVNLPSGQASLQMADVVFRTGLLTERTAGDLGYPTVPLAELHADAAQRALRAGGVDARLDVTARRLVPGRPFVVETDKGAVQGDAVILAVPHPEAAALLPADALSGRPDIRALGVSPILNVHVVYDRRVTDLAFAAAVDSPVQWVFDRTGPSGLGRGQYLAVSVSAAERCIDRPSRELCRQFAAGLQELFPHARAAGVLDMFVTRERTATFRATPGSARLRPGPTTKVDRLFLAGAWTDTGWPATMEGAVRSGRAAAAAAYQRLGDPAPDQLPSPAPARTHTGAMA